MRRRRQCRHDPKCLKRTFRMTQFGFTDFRSANFEEPCEPFVVVQKVAGNQRNVEETGCIVQRQLYLREVGQLESAHNALDGTQRLA